MKDIEVLNNGNVSVFGVKIGVDASYAKNILSNKYKVEDASKGFWFFLESWESFNKVSFHFTINESNRVCRIMMSYVSSSSEVERFYYYLKKEFEGLYDTFKDSNDGNSVTRSEYVTNLVNIKIRYQINNVFNTAWCEMESPLLFVDNVNELHEMASKLYTKDYSVNNITKLGFFDIKLNQIIKAVFVILGLIIAYLFALNSRYHYRGDTVIDNWTGNVGYVEDVDGDIYWGG